MAQGESTLTYRREADAEEEKDVLHKDSMKE